MENKNLTTVATVVFVIVFAISALIAIFDDIKINKENQKLIMCIDSLNREAINNDSIMEYQSELLLQLTYQHEDDDALMEEEMP